MSNGLSANWRQELALGDRETCLALLPKIELLASSQPDAYQALLPLAGAEDFALRLRALLALGRLGQQAAFLPLLPDLAKERQNHWRLAILDTLLVLPYPDKITPMLPFLAEDQPNDGDAYFLAGLVWFFGQQGPPALIPLCEYLLAKEVRARRLKDDLLAEALFLAANGEKQLLDQLAKEYPACYRFCDNRIWPQNLRPRFSLYPNPDYLLQIALKTGLSQGQFRRLYFWHREGKPGRSGPWPKSPRPK